MTISWVDDPVAETRIKEFGLSFSVQTRQMKDIDLEGSRQNNARIHDPIIDTVVEEYSLAMSRGAQFPRPVNLLRHGKGDLILSGNHRTTSADALGEKAIEAYIVECSDPMIIDLLPRSLNRTHGVRQSKEEAMEHAIYSINKYSKDAKEAADLFGLKYDWIKDELRARKILAELQDAGIDSSKITKTSALKLNALSANSNVLTNAAKVVVAGKMPLGDVIAMVDNVKKEKTELSQMAAVAKYEKATEHPGRPQKHTRSVRTKFLMALTNFESIVNLKSSLSQLQVTEQNEQKEIKTRLGSLAKRIETLCDNRAIPRKKGNGRKA